MKQKRGFAGCLYLIFKRAIRCGEISKSLCLLAFYLVSKKYIKEFNKANYRKYEIRVRKENIDLIKWLDKQPSKTAYIIDLIEKDMNKNK